MMTEDARVQARWQGYCLWLRTVESDILEQRQAMLFNDVSAKEANQRILESMRVRLA